MRVKKRVQVMGELLTIRVNLGKENGVLPLWTYRYPFDHQTQSTLGPVSTWMGDHTDDKCVRQVLLEGVPAS